ncbi:MAG: hypothetical protein WDZ40_00830 [Candidatus Spechtbacterales bacterium]
MKQIKGGFDTKVFGTRFLFVSKTTLISKKGNKVAVFSLHITPFLAIGITLNNKNK